MTDLTLALLHEVMDQIKIARVLLPPPVRGVALTQEQWDVIRQYADQDGLLFDQGYRPRPLVAGIEVKIVPDGEPVPDGWGDARPRERQYRYRREGRLP